MKRNKNHDIEISMIRMSDFLNELNDRDVCIQCEKDTYDKCLAYHKIISTVRARIGGNK